MVVTADAGQSARRGEVLVVCIVLCGYAVILGLIATKKPLWHDELFTFYIAGQNGPSEVVSALVGGADINPPVDYWLRQLSMKAVGATAFGLRLPSILGFVLGLLCIWAFLRRRSASAAWFGALFPIATLAFHYGTEGRLYGVLFLTMALSMLAWQRAAEHPRSTLRLALFFLCITSGPFTHHYGVLNYLPIIAGEAASSVRRRAVSPGILICLLASLLTLPLLLYFTGAAVDMKPYFHARSFDPSAAVEAYSKLIVGAGWRVNLGVLFAAVGVLWGLSRAAGRRPDLATGEVIASIVLALTPFSGYVLSRAVTGVWADRYVIVTTVGVALLAGLFVDLINRKSRAIAWALVALVAVRGGTFAQSRVTLDYRWPIPQGLEASIARIGTKVAVNDPSTFLELYYTLPETQKRKLVFLTDRAAAREFVGWDNDQIAIPGLGQVVPFDTEPFAPFSQRHRVFAVVFDSLRPGWLLAQLRQSPVELVPIERFDRFEVFEARLLPPTMRDPDDPPVEKH